MRRNLEEKKVLILCSSGKEYVLVIKVQTFEEAKRLLRADMLETTAGWIVLSKHIESWCLL